MSLTAYLRRSFIAVSRAIMRWHASFHDSFLEAGRKADSIKPYEIRNQPSKAEKLVVHFNGNFAVGGSTQLIVDLIELSGQDFRHEIVVPRLPNKLMYAPVTIRGISVDRMEEVREYLKLSRPTLVHIHYWSRAENRFDATGVWYAAVLAICDDLALTVVQNVNVPTLPMKGAPIVENVYVSQFVADNYPDRSVSSSIIYPGSDFSHFTNHVQEPPENCIGMVYRLDSDKLSENSIEPFIAVLKQRLAATAIIVGTGQLYNYFRERVDEEALSERVWFAGHVSYGDLPSMYDRMTLFVAPVHNESFGQVTPFAMSMGLPVAGYRVGALSEILGTDTTLAPPGDVAALTDIIVNLLDDKVLRKRLGDKNRQRALDRFSREKMVDQYCRLYDSVLRG